MDRLKAKYVVDAGLAAAFFASFVTGLIKFPGLISYFGISRADLPIGAISKVHDWSGLAMGILVFVHLVQHWQWIVCMTKKYIGTWESAKKCE